MIRLDAVTQNYRAAAPIFFDVSLDIPTNRRVALLGVAQSGKTTLIQMLAGLMAPSSGTIHRMARLSFPAGYQRGFRMGASVRQNLAFAAQIYDADEGDLFEFVGEVTGLQDLLDAPLKDLAVQERVNLSFALNVTSSEPAGSPVRDTLTVELRNAAGTTVLQTLGTYSNQDQGPVAIYATKDLAIPLSYPGQTLQLRFSAATDAANLTTFRIDDVGVTYTP